MALSLPASVKRRTVTSIRPFRSSIALAIAALVSLAANAIAATKEENTSPRRIDYLTFASGAVPIAIGGAGLALGASFEAAIRAIDGGNARYVLNRKPGAPGSAFGFVYQLPAPTVFDRFAVPDVVETPSPSQTFVRDVEVHGSAIGAGEGYVLLASGTLAIGSARDAPSELTVHARTQVRWVKLRLGSGIETPKPQMFFEFSELIGNGTQQAPALSNRFSGAWKGRGVQIALQQDGRASCRAATTRTAICRRR